METGKSFVDQDVHLGPDLLLEDGEEWEFEQIPKVITNQGMQKDSKQINLVGVLF